MNITESFKIAIKCIKANWMRSLLTMLGIIIGISSVIMIVGAGTGARDYIVSLIEEMGSNSILLSVDQASAADSDFITLDDISNIKEKVNQVDRCSPFMLGLSKTTLDSRGETGLSMIMGANADMVFAMKEGCSYGRFFTEEEYNSSAPVALIEKSSAEAVFGYTDVVGETVTLSSSGGTKKIKIIGVADISSVMSSASSGMSFTDMMATNNGFTIMLMTPCTTLAELTGSGTKLNMAFVVAEEGADNKAVGNATINYLKSVHGNYDKNVYTAEDMATYIAIVDVVMQVLTAFIACIGAISLIVGGIGVMNIMLVSVTERTREIGIRKSLGAKTSTITFQFLTESIIICFIGGLIGLTLGILGAYGACAIVGITPKITWWIILIALLFSSGVGLFFGIYPARKAALLSPIEALRRE
ncbi:MAG: ABC transporter permease [Eubacterium sp.]|nr:ABC transporter permease [Eubacterium sp.]